MATSDKRKRVGVSGKIIVIVKEINKLYHFRLC